MFTVVEDHLYQLDIGEYTSYGIAAGDTVISDISTERSFVDALVQLFEKEQLAPEHLREAVEDAIILASILSAQ